ncbi:sel1 repeat family protein [Francisella philomiragia]|uniref:tetratricopeptide repeat protein n=1 Tax=Francisella philomiragia TaxID=28110 RepID=UPI000B58A782|nr:SEL1-like repeat protein [Francisella philomiragia]MBK2095433.1 sel1 repeat family protein [Francisella philomiragia]
MKVRFVIAFLSVMFFGSSYATLKECYKDGVDQEYEKVLESCKPYLKTDARATGLLAEANVQLDMSDKDALDYALWASDFYEKNGAPTDPEGIRSYSYLVYLIGELYFFGSEGVDVDQPKGIEYITKSADLGYDVAQNQLGNLYVRNDKVPGMNVAKAYMWYKLAIANGSLEARGAYLINNQQKFIQEYPYCMSLGRAFIADAYLDGTGGLPKSPDYAIKWYQKAYDLDHSAEIEAGLAEAYYKEYKNINHGKHSFKHAGMAEALVAKDDKQRAYKYAREAITQPYAPAFAIMAELTDNKVAKYAYLSEAIKLYNNPLVGFWRQFNPYCMPDLSDKKGLKKAEQELAKIKLTPEEKELAIREQESLEIYWNPNAKQEQPVQESSQIQQQASKKTQVESSKL